MPVPELEIVHIGRKPMFMSTRAQGYVIPLKLNPSFRPFQYRDFRCNQNLKFIVAFQDGTRKSSAARIPV